MNTEEIIKKYNDELKAKTDNYEGIMNEWGGYFFYEKHLEVRENLHKSAMECINNILSPELKIFLKNLCSNKLGYPDEVIFYKVFGDDPEIGQSVSRKELEEKGIDVKEFEKMLDYWGLEGNFVEKETTDGMDYYYLNSLCERADITTEEEMERLNSSVELKEAILRMPEDILKHDKCIELVDDLLLGVTPQRLHDKQMKKHAKEIVELAENKSIDIPKDLLDYFKSVL